MEVSQGPLVLHGRHAPLSAGYRRVGASVRGRRPAYLSIFALGMLYQCTFCAALGCAMAHIGPDLSPAAEVQRACRWMVGCATGSSNQRFPSPDPPGPEDSPGLGYPLAQIYLDACHNCYKYKRGFVVEESELVCIACRLAYRIEDEVWDYIGACAPISIHSSLEGDSLAIPRNLLERAARYF